MKSFSANTVGLSCELERSRLQPEIPLLSSIPDPRFLPFVLAFPGGVRRKIAPTGHTLLVRVSSEYSLFSDGSQWAFRSPF